MIIQGIAGSVFLGICSITDILSRKIYLNVCLGFLAAGILINIQQGQGTASYFIKALLPGALVMLIALVTKESIGIGDGFIIIIMGVIYGFRNVLSMCGFTFLILSAYCIVMLFIGKMKLNDKIPFSPFLMIGNMIFIMYGGLV